MTLPIMKDYAQSPSNRGRLNKAGHTDGSAIDIGWRLNPNNPNQPAYSLTDAKVFDVAYISDGGNVIVAGASYDDKYDMWWSVQHLQKLPNVKKGDLLKQGQQFGNMGNTGKSNGEHFHVRVSLVPKGSKFSWATFNSYRVDPVNYVFAYAHQDVIDLKKKPAKPFIKIESKGDLIEELGTFTSTTVNGSNVRKEPNLDASSRVRGIPKGGKFDYTHYLDVDGIRWVTNGKEYVARRKLDNSEVYGDAAFRNVAPKPTPKPVTNVGKYANMSGKTWLFKVSRSDETYPSGLNQLTNLKSRSAKILADDNGRVKISVPSFRPNVVWVAKNQISITDKPKYSVN